jgi:hypothetical protein
MKCGALFATAGASVSLCRVGHYFPYTIISFADSTTLRFKYFFFTWIKKVVYVIYEAHSLLEINNNIGENKSMENCFLISEITS